MGPSTVPLLGRTISTIALFCSLLTGGGCKGEQAASQQPGQTGPPPAVVVAEVTRKTVPVYGEYVAQTVANSTVDIQARVEATLEKVLFVEGGPVRKDQVLFELDKRTYEAQVQAARAALGKAEADLVYARQQVETQRVKAQLAQNEAQLAKAKQDVERLRPLIKEDAVPQQDFDNGVASYLEVLDADTKLFSAELDLAKARREELLAGVQLYRALGGGWRGLERPATQPTAATDCASRCRSYYQDSCNRCVLT